MTTPEPATLPAALSLIQDLERDLAILGAANDALLLELATLRAGSMRGAAGLDGATAEAKRQRFMKWPAAKGRS